MVNGDPGAPRPRSCGKSPRRRIRTRRLFSRPSSQAKVTKDIKSKRALTQIRKPYPTPWPRSENPSRAQKLILELPGRSKPRPCGLNSNSMSPTRRPPILDPPFLICWPVSDGFSSPAVTPEKPSKPNRNRPGRRSHRLFFRWPRPKLRPKTLRHWNRSRPSPLK